MLTLYPLIKPYACHEVAVSPLHRLYVEQCGNPDGLSVLYLHSGPGAGCDSTSRRFFDPNKYQITLFDQRGCGRSKPYALLDDNDTQAQITDIEKIREHFNIKQWVLFGDAWGATLALAYAQSFPAQVSGMILHSPALYYSGYCHWMYEAGIARVFPDYWQEFLNFLPTSDWQNPLKAYYERLTGKDELAAMAAAKAWSQWYARSSSLRPSQEILDRYTEPAKAMALAKIASHYHINEGFVSSGALLDGVHKLARIPGIIVQGRYDLMCPLDNAYLLQKAWPLSQLRIVRDAGHLISDPAIADALLRSTSDMAKQFKY